MQHNNLAEEYSEARVDAALDVVFGANRVNPNDGSCSIHRSSLEVLLEFWEGLVHFHSTPATSCAPPFPPLVLMDKQFGVTPGSWPTPRWTHQYVLVGHLMKEYFYSASRTKNKLSISSYTWWTLSKYLWLMSHGEVWGNDKPVFPTSPQRSCASVPFFLLRLATAHFTQTTEALLTMFLSTRALEAYAQRQGDELCVHLFPAHPSHSSHSVSWSWHLGAVDVQCP